MKTKQETKEKACGLTLTERQVEDFTRLAQLQKDGAANIKDRRLITDAYRAFAAENEEALSAEGGVRAGRLKVWIEVTRAIHAEIVGGEVKGESEMKKTLAEAVKGMQVKSWEVREHSDGKRVVYVRFAPKEPTLTVNVKDE